VLECRGIWENISRGYVAAAWQEDPGSRDSQGGARTPKKTAAAVAAERRFPMKTVAEVIGVFPLVSGGAPAGMSAEADRCGVARNCDVRWICAGEKDEASAQASRDADGARAEECDSAGECYPAVRRKPAGNCDVCLRYGR
jgi:hypothetical protein